ncbi:MAG: 4-hydroxy-tetrahydrodipicolinate reductase [Clostridia bacterium]|nr:4-hydroxy-tetrahydrodipicolinate reductase [Clostridia bacterium]
MEDFQDRIRLALNGANGRMCRAIAHAVKCDSRFETAFGVDKIVLKDEQCFPVFSSFDGVPPCDVVVDFSTPKATMSALEFALMKSLPILVATTGHDEPQREKIENASKHIPVFYASNTSVGTYLVIQLAEIAAAFLSYDVEIVETHHRIKADAPSGTALEIASAIRDARRKSSGEYVLALGHDSRREERQIGIHSVRGGTVVGKHEILFLGDDERIVISHEAENKSVFVHGALKAAAFLVDKPHGLYGMKDLLENQC